MTNPIVLALATQRLTQLVTDDELTRPIRQAVNDWAGDAPEFSFKDRVATLIACPACTSVWAAGGLLVVNLHPAGRWLTKVLALSGAALIVEAGVKRLGK